MSGSIRKLHWQSLIVDLGAERISVSGQAIPASPAECRTMAALLGQRNRPMSKETVCDIVFGSDHGRDARQIDVFVARLRQKLTAAGLTDAIATVPGRGYAMFDDEHGAPQPFGRFHEKEIRVAA